LFAYWRNSEPRRYAEITAQWITLIATCAGEHETLAEEAGSTALLRPVGFIQAYNDAATLEADLAEAERARELGVNSVALTPAKLAEMERHLGNGFIGALHWTDPYAVNDPHALTLSYAALFERLGGRFAIGDAATLRRNGAGWRVTADDGSVVEAEDAIVALGIWSGGVTRHFGYMPPLFGKRGYHLHFTPRGNAGLTRPVASNGFLLAPMRQGIRLTTGAEFARGAAQPSPVQLARAEPIARSIFPLGDAVEPAPWMGVRPCTPDMLPIIGRIPSQPHLWGAFGHAHQGFTLGPTTGRLLAEMMTGDTPFVDPSPFRADRF
jgi:D-amino-acid dehydrogenase